MLPFELRNLPQAGRGLAPGHRETLLLEVHMEATLLDFVDLSGYGPAGALLASPSFSSP